MIRRFENQTPKLAKTVYVDETAVVIGQVEIGDFSSIWPQTVVRGDVNRIVIGERTNIQDLSVIHVNHAGPFNESGEPTIIGNDVTIGHRVLLHACTIADRCLIGMGAIILDRVEIQSEVFVGAGSLVTPGSVLESGYLYLGAPAKRARKLTEKELAHIPYSAEYYAELAKRTASSR